MTLLLRIVSCLYQDMLSWNCRSRSASVAERRAEEQSAHEEAAAAAAEQMALVREEHAKEVAALREQQQFLSDKRLEVGTAAWVVWQCKQALPVPQGRVNRAVPRQAAERQGGGEGMPFTGSEIMVMHAGVLALQLEVCLTSQDPL